MLVTKRRKRRPPSRRRRVLLILMLPVILGAAFYAGAYAQREKHLRRWKETLAEWKLRYDPSYVGNYLRSRVSGADLPTLHIDMKFRHYDKVVKKREEALRKGILFSSDDDFVPCTITVGDEKLDAKLRLKGDELDHLLSEKWSYRVHIRGEGSFRGMRRFSLQHPMTRAYHLEWGFLEHARKEGLAAPRYMFVHVVDNGTPKGIYALEEHFCKELLEASQRREGPILKYVEGPQWENWARGGKTVAHGLSSRIAPRDFRLSSIAAFGEARLERDPVLARLRDAGITHLRDMAEGRRAPSEVFDVDLMGKLLALVEIWNAPHALGWINLRFYYNPVTARLEPVPFDAEPTLLATRRLVVTGDRKFLDGFWGLLLEDVEIAGSYLENLDRMTDPGYLADLRESLGERMDDITTSLHREWPWLETPWGALERKLPYVKGAADPAAWITAYVRRDRSSLEVSNLLSLPVIIDGVRVGGEDVDIEKVPVTLPPAPYRGFTDPHSIPVPAGDPTEVRVRLPGRSEERIVPARTLIAGGRAGAAPTVSAALAGHPFLEKIDGDRLRVRKGTWEVAGDLHLPEGVGLEMGPGTSLQFQPGAILHATGPLIWEGTDEEPVEVGPSGETWGGIIVERAGGRSSLRHVIIRDTAGIDRQGWILTGAVTFFESPVSLVRCRLDGSSAEDLINVIRSNFEFVESEFGPCASDAFDGDFVTGSLQRCAFHDTGGDAVDVSGSTVEVKDLSLRKIGDKGISAGEDSKVTAQEVDAEDVGIAFASKDLSFLIVRDGSVRGARIGLAAYRKKPEFGSARIDAQGVSLEDTGRVSLVQEGSRVTLNGKRIPGEPVDVQAMYDQGILGN